MENNRITWVDIAKGFGIILVMFGHSSLKTEYTNWWVNSFHMPLFFVLAGVCFDERRYPTLYSYTKRKIIALLYPYVTLSLLVIGLMALLYWGDNPEFRTSSLLHYMALGGTIGAFWFITALLEVELLYAILRKCIDSMWIRIILTGACYFLGTRLVGYHLPYFIDAALNGLIFYGLGHALRPCLTSGSCRLHNVKFLTGVWMCTGVIHVLLLIFYAYTASFVGNRFKIPEFYLLLAVLGSSTVITFSIILDGLHVRFIRLGCKCTRFLGRNTIILLATHNALGLCRSSWGISTTIGRLLEFTILASLLYLISGPLNFLVKPKFPTLKKFNG